MEYNGISFTMRINGWHGIKGWKEEEEPCEQTINKIVCSCRKRTHILIQDQLQKNHSMTQPNTNTFLVDLCFTLVSLCVCDWWLPLCWSPIGAPLVSQDGALAPTVRQQIIIEYVINYSKLVFFNFDINEIQARVAVNPFLVSLCEAMLIASWL